MKINHKTQTHHLENGLTVLTREMHHVPIVSQWIWYRIGSRNEVPGITGISHWVEHMQFKGTPSYPIHELDAAISRNGGVWNAMTSLDWTTYYETLPANKIDIALDLEADRMTNSVFDINEVELERNVVISEREGNQNEPLFQLSESVRKAAFAQHSYATQVIGELVDLKAITRADLFRHYQDYYTPNNAVLVLAGDFDTAALLEKITNRYGGTQSNSVRTPTLLPEKTINQTAVIEKEGPGDTIYLQISYRAPSARLDDFFSLLVLDSLLTGPSSIAMFGGGSVSNKVSRLYQQIVETDLAVAVSGGLQATIDPYLYEILAILPPEKNTKQVIHAIDKQIAILQDNLVKQSEIDRAIKQAKALFAYGSESITNQAFWMGYASMFADHTWFDTYISRIENITPAMVQYAAQHYLDPSHRIIGIYRPAKKEGTLH